MNSKQQKEFGDYQTPLSFAILVCRYLKEHLKISPDFIIEPTCGLGTFINASSLFFHAKSIVGIEVNEKYLQESKKISLNSTIYWFHADFFQFDLNNLTKFIQPNDHILLIGNPPWVNNSNLSNWNSKNVPLKNNERKLKGLDALTGCSNFDICESMILKLIRHFQKNRTTLAMLCKTKVAHNIFREMVRNQWNFHEFRILNFNATEIFHAATDACLLIIQWNPPVNLISNSSLIIDACSSQTNPIRNYGEIYDWNNDCLGKFGFKNSTFYSNLNDQTIDLSGKCCFEWRQGIKHDCAAILELTSENCILRNKNNEVVDIEDNYVYPLIKSRDFKKCIIKETGRYVIVTQNHYQNKHMNIDEYLPRTWNYLMQHKESFEKRKSSIYKNRPLFSLFGIGDYSFSNVKVGVSGFYSLPRFSLIYSSKPFMLDDTCYSISLESYEMGYSIMLLLNSSIVQHFLTNLALINSKRPFTKKILQQIDFNKCLDYLKFEDIKQTENELKLSSFFQRDHYERLLEMVSKRNV